MSLEARTVEMSGVTARTPADSALTNDAGGSEGGNPRRSPPLRARPVTLEDANVFIRALHRHHKPVPGAKFAIGATTGEELVGVAVVSRPVARLTDQYAVAEVTRLCTNGHKNACSFLYGACARAAKAMGYDAIQTFTLPEEGGASLRAAGFEKVPNDSGGKWGRPSRVRLNDGQQPLAIKDKWVRILREDA
jgi:hypothetical protein